MLLAKTRNNEMGIKSMSVLHRHVHTIKASGRDEIELCLHQLNVTTGGFVSFKKLLFINTF